MDDELVTMRARVQNLERLADRLAHELATPLTTAHGFATILLERDDLPDDVREHLGRVVDAVGRSLAVLRDRMDEGTGEQPRAVRLRAIVRDAVVAALGDDSSAGSSLPDDRRVFGDPAALRAVLGLVFTALREHARSSGAAADLEVEYVQSRATAHQLRITANGRRLGPAVDIPSLGAVTTPTVARQLGEAAAMLGRLGGRFWPDDPRHDGAGVAALVDLPRDVDD